MVLIVVRPRLPCAQSWQPELGQQWMERVKKEAAGKSASQRYSCFLIVFNVERKPYSFKLHFSSSSLYKRNVTNIQHKEKQLTNSGRRKCRTNIIEKGTIICSIKIILIIGSSLTKGYSNKNSTIKLNRWFSAMNFLRCCYIIDETIPWLIVGLMVFSKETSSS